MGIRDLGKKLGDTVEHLARGSSSREQAASLATVEDEMKLAAETSRAKAIYDEDQARFVEQARYDAWLYARTNGTRYYDDDPSLQQGSYAAPCPTSLGDRWGSILKPATQGQQQSFAQSPAGEPSGYAPQGDHLSLQNSYTGWDQATQPGHGQPPSSPAPSAYSGATVSVPPISSPSLAPKQPQSSLQAPTTDVSKQSTNNTVSGM